MIRLHWRERLQTFFGGNLIEKGFQTDEAYVTQLLELGQTSGIEDFDQALLKTMIHP